MLAPDSSAGGSQARKVVCHQYRSLLQQLTSSSKRRIDVLTILAKKRKHFSKDIVSLIEAQIAKAPPSQKLPIMYLMDSIVKNVAGDYLPAFARNLPRIFPCVFEEVDATTKKSLFQLRSTWNGIFPAKKLLVLDIRVNVIDPAWPIKPLPANLDFSSILAKCKFPKKSKQDTATEDAENQSGKQGSPGPSPKGSQSPCTEERSSRKRRCGSLSPSSSPPKIRKVSFVSVQPGPQDQGQEHFPHPGCLVQNPAGAVGNPPRYS